MPDFDVNNINFSNYLANGSKEYKFTVKLAALDLTEDQVNSAFEKIFYALEKYGLVSSDSKLSKTPIQKNPLDFPNVKNTEVYIANFVCKYPASRDALRVYLAGVIGLSDQLVAVYSESDPRIAQTEQHLERNDPNFKKDYVPNLGNEQKWPEEAPYGDAYNENFLKELKDKSDESKSEYITNSLIPKQKIDKSAHLGDETSKQNNVSPLTKVKLPPKFKR